MYAIDQCPQAFRLGRILFFRLIQFKADFIFDPGQIPFSRFDKRFAVLRRFGEPCFLLQSVYNNHPNLAFFQLAL